MIIIMVMVMVMGIPLSSASIFIQQSTDVLDKVFCGPFIAKKSNALIQFFIENECDSIVANRVIGYLNFLM